MSRIEKNEKDNGDNEEKPSKNGKIKSPNGHGNRKYKQGGYVSRRAEEKI